MPILFFYDNSLFLCGEMLKYSKEKMRGSKIDANKWQKYELKKKEMKKMVKSKVITIWLIWLIVVAVALIGIFYFKDKIGIEFSVIASVVLLGFSVLVALNKTGEYIKVLKQQEALLEQEESFGRFNT